jgi:hypothetical protein
MRSVRLPQAASSSVEKALSSDSIGTRWRTGANAPAWTAPTVWVGESSVRRSG